MELPRRLHPAARDAQVTDSERRAQETVRLVAAGESLTAAELAQRTGFPLQAAAVAMETLQAVGWVEKVWHTDLRIWRWEPRNPAGYTPPHERPPREDRVYTIKEAAAATGLSEKAITRR